ncbi:related to F1F0-ATP synthase subunit G [Cephalotrichum gorgonifer]|uniref:Related to F1F0-ATP synthase subunit G n=1 Tax=Cephalotrichum gorgonifer TaxID=2041049 RepID=A0AAE8SVW3_9PEZI|nr:related to F1F0-ATP synthase subunit G [Cephalotrichum gorgonifer]
MLARPILRASRRTPTLTPVRFSSTGGDAAKEAAAKAKDTAGKAAEGLSRVTSAAGPAISGAAKGVAGALGKVGGRTGKVIGFVEKQIPYVVHYSKVGLELGKIVFRGQNMSPPSVSTFQSFYEAAWRSIRKPGSLVETATKSLQPAQGGLVRGVSNAQLAAAGVVAAECLGFFTVGEMIGRFKIVGYHGEPAAAAH